MEAVVDFLVLLKHELEPFLHNRMDAPLQITLLLAKKLFVFFVLSADFPVQFFEFVLKCIPLLDIQKVVLNALFKLNEGHFVGFLS